MVTKKEIEVLLKGRDIIDKYRSVKINRSDPKWKHPPIPAMIRALEELGFRDIDDFFLYDTKLSFQEIADVAEVVSSKDGVSPFPVCDNCSDRQPRGCEEMLRISGVQTTCASDRLDMRVDSSDAFYATKRAALYLEDGDPIYKEMRAQALSLGVEKTMLFTLDDIVLSWNYSGHVAAKCVWTVKLKRKFDFDPFWKLGELCLPVASTVG